MSKSLKSKQQQQKFDELKPIISLLKGIDKLRENLENEPNQEKKTRINETIREMENTLNKTLYTEKQIQEATAVYLNIKQKEANKQIQQSSAVASSVMPEISSEDENALEQFLATDEAKDIEARLAEQDRLADEARLADEQLADEQLAAAANQADISRRKIDTKAEEARIAEEAKEARIAQEADEEEAVRLAAYELRNKQRQQKQEELIQQKEELIQQNEESRQQDLDTQLDIMTKSDLKKKQNSAKAVAQLEEENRWNAITQSQSDVIIFAEAKKLALRIFGLKKYTNDKDVKKIYDELINTIENNMTNNRDRLEVIISNAYKFLKLIVKTENRILKREKTIEEIVTLRDYTAFVDMYKKLSFFDSIIRLYPTTIFNKTETSSNKQTIKNKKDRAALLCKDISSLTSQINNKNMIPSQIPKITGLSKKMPAAQEISAVQEKPAAQEISESPKIQAVQEKEKEKKDLVRVLKKGKTKRKKKSDKDIPRRKTKKNY
jgi:hypothetical protein